MPAGDECKHHVTPVGGGMDRDTDGVQDPETHRRIRSVRGACLCFNRGNVNHCFVSIRIYVGAWTMAVEDIC